MELEEQKIVKRLNKAQRERNHDQLAAQYNKLGDLRTNQGLFDEALTAFKEALTSCKRLGDDMRLGYAHRMVGEAYIQLGNWDKGLKHQTLYLNLARKANDMLEQQRAWASIGRAQICIAESKAEEGDEEMRKQALAAAKNANMKSLAIASNHLNHLKKRELVEMKARLMLNLGLIHEYQNHGDEALKKIEKAVDLCETNELFEDWARSLVSLGALKFRQGDCVAALADLGTAMEVAKRLPPEDKLPLTCDALVAQSEVFFVLEDFSAAKHALHKAYKLKPASEGVREIIEKNLKIAITAIQAERKLQELDESEYLERKALYEKIADCGAEVRAFNVAIDFYKKMLVCSEALGESGSELSACLFSLGKSYKDNKQYPEALEYLERDYELWSNNPKEACKSMIEIASIHKITGDSISHLEALEKAKMQAILGNNKTLQIEILDTMASCYRSRGDRKEAEELETEMLDLRAVDSETASSQDVGNSQDQGGADVWEDVDLGQLSSDLSETEEKEKPATSRLRQRNVMKVTKNEKGETGLHKACIQGKLDQVKKLIEGKHPVNIRDNAGWTPLHEACNYGYIDIVEYLLDHGANIDDKGGHDCDGVTPLHDAASNGCMDTLELLLDRGADVTAKTYKKPRQTAYHYFVKWHNESSNLLDDEKERFYQSLKSRMKQAMERAGLTVNDVAEESDYAVTSAMPALQREGVAARRSDSPQPSTSASVEHRRPSFENRAIMRLKKSNPMRILSGSSQSDDDGLQGVGSLRRRADSTKKLNSDDELDLPSSSSERRKPSDRKWSDLSSSDLEEIPLRPKKQVYGGSSAREYADIMQTIRGKHRHLPKGPEPIARSNRSALLHEGEIEEEWLEDDIGAANPSQATKRRRISSPTSTIPSHNRESRIQRNIVSSRSPSPEVEDMDLDADIEDFPPPSPPRKKASPIKRSPLKLTPTKSPLKRILPYGVIQTSQSRPAEKVESLKVRINELFLLVPVPSRDLNISWLADEVAQRYYRVKKLMPQLMLQTKDGALLSPDDPVSLLLSNKDEEVLAKVESLTLPPISDRYKEACLSLNQAEDVHLLACLNSCQVTLSLNVANLSLEAQCSPLLHALTRQHLLKELHLSGCGLGDLDFEKLCPALETLENVSTLDLSCNNISLGGLKRIKDLVTENNALKTLTSLNLSYNPLEFESLEVLGPILECMSSLSKLYIKDCGITIPVNTLIENLPLFNLDSLTELDVSHNALGSLGLAYFFGRIDAWQMQVLNIAHTSTSNQEEGSSAAREVAMLLQRVIQQETPGGNITTLDISGCQLADVDVYELLRSLNDSGMTLKNLILSSNPELTAVCLRSLLQHSPTLAAINLTGCPKVVFPLQATDVPTSLTSLCVTAKNKADREILIQAWVQAKSVSALCRQGPSGLLQLKVL